MAIESPPPTVLSMVRRAVRLRHFSPRTEEAYVSWTRRFLRFHSVRHPRTMGLSEVQDFLTDLAERGRVSSATQNQAAAAMLFLYRRVLGRELVNGEREVGMQSVLRGAVRAKAPKRLPTVLGREEVVALLSRMRGVPWSVACLLTAPDCGCSSAWSCG